MNILFQNDRIHNQSLKTKISRYVFLYLSIVVSTPAVTLGNVDIDVTGLSYHIGGSSSNPAYTKAPRRLDKNGVFVFNPGIGIGYDSRTLCNWKGLSPIFKAIYFRDCDDRGFYMLGGGCRYRYFFTESFSGDINVGVTVAWGQQWSTGKYKHSILPLLLLGPNYHFILIVKEKAKFFG